MPHDSPLRFLSLDTVAGGQYQRGHAALITAHAYLAVRIKVSGVLFHMKSKLDSQETNTVLAFAFSPLSVIVSGAG